MSTGHKISLSFISEMSPKGPHVKALVLSLVLREDLMGGTGSVPLKGIETQAPSSSCFFDSYPPGGEQLLLPVIPTTMCCFATDPKATGPVNHGLEPTKL
jgi:hypothetical protein